MTLLYSVMCVLVMVYTFYQICDTRLWCTSPLKEDVCAHYSKQLNE